jgi:hypothetical protein
MKTVLTIPGIGGGGGPPFKLEIFKLCLPFLALAVVVQTLGALAGFHSGKLVTRMKYTKLIDACDGGGGTNCEVKFSTIYS